MDDVERDVSPIVENEAEAVIKFASDIQIGPHLLRAHQSFAKLPVKEYICTRELIDNVIARQDKHLMGPHKFTRRIRREPGVDGHIRWLSGNESFFA